MNQYSGSSDGNKSVGPLLSLAAGLGLEHVTELFLDYGAVVDAEDDTGGTALYRA